MSDDSRTKRKYVRHISNYDSDFLTEHPIMKLAKKIQAERDEIENQRMIKLFEEHKRNL